MLVATCKPTFNFFFIYFLYFFFESVFTYLYFSFALLVKCRQCRYVFVLVFHVVRGRRNAPRFQIICTKKYLLYSVFDLETPHIRLNSFPFFRFLRSYGIDEKCLRAGCKYSACLRAFTQVRDRNCSKSCIIPIRDIKLTSVRTVADPALTIPQNYRDKTINVRRHDQVSGAST